MQYITTKIKKHNTTTDTINFHYSDYIDAEKCYNRLIRETNKDNMRQYHCQVIVRDRTTQRLFKEIEPSNL